MKTIEDITSGNISLLESMTRQSERPVIITHMKPDGDAIGSTTAMFIYLRSSGGNPVLVLNDTYPDNLSFLVTDDIREHLAIFEEKPEEAKKAIKEADLIICLDFNAFHRTDNLEDSLAGSTGKKILIDHHLNPDREHFDLVFSETETSSASELLYHILMATETISGHAGNLPEGCAEALMTGMTTDTNNFANSVYPSTLRMASALLEAGVDRDAILNRLYNQFSENRLRLMGHMMKDLLTITEDGVAYIVLDRKTQESYCVSEGDTEGFVNMPLSIASVRMSLLLKEDGDRIRVSIRSKKGTSANMCARKHFNGGGHENAAGGRLYIPENVASIEDAGSYIETHTHTFLTEENGN